MGRVKDGYREMAKRANEVAEAKGLMAGWNKVVQFIVEGEGDFYIKFENGVATFHEGKHEKPDVTLKGPEEVFYNARARASPTQLDYGAPTPIRKNLSQRMSQPP
jgi:hypothetical protein